MRSRRRRLTLSSLTLGDVDFVRRVEAAAGAGFSGIGLRAEDYVAARDAGLSDADMAAVLADHGITVTEVELLAGWAGSVSFDPAQREKEETILHVARTFGADHVNAGLFQPLPIEVVVPAFAALCRRMGEARVALEFMPFGCLPDLAATWEVLRRADPLNAGLLIDAWHWARSGAVPQDLAAVPADAIIVVQLCDVAEQPMSDLRQETLHHRLAPGRGYGDVPGLLRALRDHGVDAPISVEVMSDELLALGVEVAAEQVMAGAIEVLAAS